MKKNLFTIIVLSHLLLTACNNTNSNIVFMGEGENWNGKLFARYNFLGEEIQSLQLTYMGDSPEKLKETNVFVESSDFLGWGLGEIEFDEKGNFNSVEVFKLDSKTPITSTISLKIEGDKTETIILTSK